MNSDIGTGNNPGAGAYYDGAGDYDRETVRFFDIAHEGAQLRAVAGVVESVGLSELEGMQPRSVVILGTDQIARAAARYVVQVRSPLRTAVLVAERLPVYVGALDVVLMVGDAAANDDYSRDLISAGKRGATVILAGPAQGPLIEDAPRETLLIPALPTTAGASPARTMAAVAAVLDVLEQPGGVVAQKLNDLADEVDEELINLSPERDSTVNPARQLREFVSGAQVLHTGVSHHGKAVAEFVATLWSTRGLPSGYCHPDEMSRAVEQQPAAADSIFHDPFLDGPSGLVPLKTIMWTHDDAPWPQARPENSLVTGLGDTAVALRLITRAFAVTALDD